MLDNIPIDLGKDKSYSSSMRALAAFHGKNYPRWYSSTVAGFHTNFYYYETEKEFKYFFSTPEEVVNGTVSALNTLGFETKSISGLGWLESWEILKTAVEQKTPVMVGPLNAEEIGHSETCFDHYSIVAGVTGQDVVLKDPEGINNMRLDLDTFRLAWEKGVPYSKEGHRYCMIITKRRTQPMFGEKELCARTLKKVSEKYFSQHETRFEEGILLSGRKAVEALAEKLSSGKKQALNILRSLAWNGNTGNVTRFETALFVAYARKFWDTDEMKELNQEMNSLSESWLSAENALKQAAKGSKKARAEAAEKLMQVTDKEEEIKERLLKLDT